MYRTTRNTDRKFNVLAPVAAKASIAQAALFRFGDGVARQPHRED